MRSPSLFLCGAFALIGLYAGGCGGLQRNQTDVSGGNGRNVTLGGTSGGGQTGSSNGGGTGAGTGGSGQTGGSGGAACVPPGATAACAACEAAQCTTNLFIYGPAPDGGAFDASNYNPGSPGPGQDIDWYALCYHVTGTAPSGPMKGAKNSDLCAAVVDCVHRTGCDASDPSFPCYCGEGNTSDGCFGGSVPPTGPCKDVIAYGAWSTTPSDVVSRRMDFSYPTGAAIGLLQYCDYSDTPSLPGGTAPCTSACLGGADGGTSCGAPAITDGGQPHDGGQSGSGGRAGAGGGSGGGGGSAAGGAAGGQGNACTTTYRFTDADACKACELGSGNSYCNQALVSATLTSDDEGNQVPVGFGPDTLATTAQQDASFAIIQRALSAQCYSNGNLTVQYRPANSPGCTMLATDPCIHADFGCLLDLGQPTGDLMAGNFGTNPTFSALAEFTTAAIADATAGMATLDSDFSWGAPGGLSAGASNATLGSYFSKQAGHPSSAIGMAVQVLLCGLASNCTACFDLTATKTCPGGAGGAGGSAGGGGAAGAAATGGSGGIGGTTGTGGTAGADGTGSGGTAGGGAAGSRGTGGAVGATGGTAGSPTVCPDLDGDGQPDCQQTLVHNPGFDSSISGWTAEPSTTASWTSLDGAGHSSSGAIAVANGDTNPADGPFGTTTAGATQCVAVASGTCYQVAVQTSIPAGQGVVSAGFVLDEHTTSDCSQAAVTSFVSPQVSTTGSWQTVSGKTTQIPVNVASVAVRLVAVKPVGQSSAQALFDNVLVRAATCPSR